MSLDEINSKYNVVNVSFFYTETSYTMPTYRPNNPEAIKNAVAKLQSQGRRVLISMGGATGGNMRFRKDQKDDLKVAIKQTIEEYNFDGLDID
jgi:chitinase